MKRLFVMDGHSHLFRAYHAVGYLSTSKGVPSHAVLILSTMLWKLIREEQPEYLGIAWDPPGPTFRDHLFTDYKATRTAMPDDLVRQLPYVRRLFAALRTPVIEVSGYEADDVLATLVDKALALDVDEVVIVTGDKDLLQLVGPRVRVVSVLGRTGEKIVYDEAKVRERWGVDPAQIVDVLALMGDSIDNIPGVHGVGEKTAVKLISQYGSVPRLYDNLTLVTGKLRETLAAGRKSALLSRELATLNHEVPVAFDLEAFRRVEPDWTKLRALWMEMEFTRLLKELPAPPVAVVSSKEPVARLEAAKAMREYLARAGDAPVGLDWAGDRRPPEPRPAAAVMFTAAAGAAALPAADDGAVTGELANHVLVVHDGKALIEWWLGGNDRLPVIEDTAVGAYLLNPARATYKLDELTREIYALAGEEFNIGSPKQLAHILFEKLKLPSARRTKTGYSTDERVLTELAVGHELPGKILEHRSLSKLKGTYADALPLLVNPATARIHTTFNQLVAATGRLSSQDPNLMNIPIRSELGKRIRAAFIPEEGWRFVAADYSQIELRILAHLSEEPAIIESFRRGEDIHTRTAVEVFKIKPEEVTSLQRTIAKSANYAILYGVSAFGLSQATRIDQKEAQRYISAYFATHPRVRAFIDRTLAEGRERGYVTTVLGRRRYLPDLLSQNPVARGAAERMAMNAPVQGTASDMIKIAMVRVAAALRERGLRARMLLQVHDELLFEAPPEEVDAICEMAREIMEAALPLS